LAMPASIQRPAPPRAPDNSDRSQHCKPAVARGLKCDRLSRTRRNPPFSAPFWALAPIPSGPRGCRRCRLPLRLAPRSTPRNSSAIEPSPCPTPAPLPVCRPVRNL
jgi:hypothetical protein